MDNSEVMAKRKERIQTIIVLSPFVFLLIWNAVFFYTGWWENYLKPIGLHTWLDSLHWLRPIYDGLETRIYQHNVDAQKYMVLLSWGVLLAMVLGLFLLICSFKSMTVGDLNHYRNNKSKLSLIVFIIMIMVVPYMILKDYGSRTDSLSHHLNDPSFVSLIFFQLVFLVLVWLLPIFISLAVQLFFLNKK